MNNAAMICFTPCARFFGVLLYLFSFSAAKSQIAFNAYQSTSTVATPAQACIGDVNNDGRADVVLTTGFSPTINSYRLLVFLQSSNGTLAATPVIYSYTRSNNLQPKGLGIADVNNDGLNDVVIGFHDSISICTQNASGALNAPVGYYSGTNVDGLKTGDLNNDGKADIVVTHLGLQLIRVFYQTTTGFTSGTYSTPTPSNAHEADIADVNGDGKADLILLTPIISAAYSGGISVYTQNVSGSLNAYTTYYPPSSGTVTTQLYGLAVGDLNNDGRMDVAATRPANSPNARIFVWYQDTVTHLLQAPDSLTAYDIPEPIEIADLDCDGKPEIVTVHGGWAQLSVYAQSSGAYSGYTGFGLSYSSHYSPYGMSVGDITGDGRKDVVIADYNTGLVTLKNVTAPSVISSVSTFIKTDTFYTHRDTSNNYTAIRVYTDTAGAFFVRHRDSLAITQGNQTDSIRNDTLVVRTGVICSGSVTDSLRNRRLSGKYKSFSDTSVIAARSDSTRLLVPAWQANILHLYPNPVSRLLTISGVIFNSLTAPQYAVLTTSDGQRQEIGLRAENGRLSADMARYPPGVYFIQLRVEDKWYYGRFVKQ